MDASQVLRQARRRTGLSQREFAVRAGISLRSLAGGEAGEREPSWRLVEAACRSAGLMLATSLPVPVLDESMRRHLRLSLTQRLWRSLGGAGRPEPWGGRRPAERPATWVHLVDLAQRAHVALTGRTSLGLWLPPPAQPPAQAPAQASAQAPAVTLTLTLRSPGGSLDLPVSRELEVEYGPLPPGLIPVPLAEPSLWVLVPSPTELALDPSCARERSCLLAVAAALHDEAPRDRAGRRTAAHRDPDHVREYADVWHDKALKRYPMPPDDDVRSWRLDDDASSASWLRRHGMPVEPKQKQKRGSPG